MVVKVTRREVDIKVARLADRLAIVETFDDGEQAGVLLDQPRNRIEILRALETIKILPGLLRLAGGFDGGVDIR